MIYNIAHKIELVPNKKQEEYFVKACGVARFSYNWALEQWNKQYQAYKQDNSLPKPNEFDLRKQLNAIKKEQYTFLLEVTKCAPQQAIKNLGKAFASFFKKQNNHPKFQKKGKNDSFYMDNSVIEVAGKKIRIPKLGWVKMRENIRFYGNIMSATISRTADKWFVSIQIAIEINPQPKAIENQEAVGVDLGVADLAILSDGTKFSGSKPLKKSLKKLKRLSRRLSKKQWGEEVYTDKNCVERKRKVPSKNYLKAKTKLAREHAKVANIRKDYLHKLTTYLIQKYDIICIEDLNVKGMMQNKKLARAISDMGFYEFKRQLLYKAEMCGKEIVIADRWFPSSKTCSECGHKAEEMPLSVREWECPNCHTHYDRDINAAINLKKYGLEYHYRATPKPTKNDNTASSAEI